MCLSTVYEIKDNKKSLIQENVAAVRVENGKVILVSILGAKTEVDAEIEKIDLMENYIVLKKYSN